VKGRKYPSRRCVEFLASRSIRAESTAASAGRNDSARPSLARIRSNRRRRTQHCSACRDFRSCQPAWPRLLVSTLCDSPNRLRGNAMKSGASSQAVRSTIYHRGIRQENWHAEQDLSCNLIGFMNRLKSLPAITPSKSPATPQSGPAGLRSVLNAVSSPSMAHHFLALYILSFQIKNAC